MRAVRICNPHIFDDGNAAINDIFCGIFEVSATVDHHQRDALSPSPSPACGGGESMFEDYDSGHGEATIQFPCDSGKVGARPIFTLQFDGQKNE